MVNMNNKITVWNLFLLLLAAQIPILLAQAISNDNDWQGQWFPYSPEAQADASPPIQYGNPDLYDAHHGVKMGIMDSSCDDAQTNLEVDWDFNAINYTCLNFLQNLDDYEPQCDVQPIFSADNIPKEYSALHQCMDRPITYNERIPTFGTHRPLWAKWGEYKFLPKQRWLHNLEHGGIVMLYHPCANKNEVNVLRVLVKKCLYRHVITPYTLLTPERPLALVSWGSRLEMSKVAPEIVTEFIRQHALNGPEQTAKDGQYDLFLEEHSEIVTDLHDQELCQAYNYLQ